MEVILHIGIAQFIFAALLIITKRHVHWADKVLSSWLGLMAIFMLLTLLKQENPDSFWAKLQMYPFAFTFGPFIYYYVKSLVNEDFKPLWTNLFHLLPFTIFSILAVTINTPVDEAFLSGASFTPQFILYSISAAASFGAYIYLTLEMLQKHRENILNHFSYESEMISLNWLRITTLGFIATLVLSLLFTLAIVFNQKEIIDPGFALFIGFTAFGYSVGYYGIRQPRIFRTSELEEEDERFIDKIGTEKDTTPTVTIIPSTQKKYARSSLTPEIANDYSRRLLEHMEQGQPFLLRDLNIQDIAENLNIPQHHLTQTINEHMDKNFYLLVNEYRVEEVKKRLLDKKYKHLTILAIAHDAGFNSKSSFNMIFKQHTDMTPTAYRKKYQ